MNNLFDIACNFSSDRFEKDLNEVIKRAKDNNVTKFLLVSASLKDAEKVNKIYQNNKDSCFLTIGAHPHHANEFDLSSPSEMRQLIEEYKPHSVGETGLDFFRNISSYEEQLFAFEEQIQIAIETNLPLFLHQRDAHDDFLKIISKYKNDISKAVVHCFTGTQKELDDYLEFGFHIGLTGWICDERRNFDLRKSLKNIPLDKLMIETDCPYLIPRNLNNKPKNNRNEPAYLPHIANEIALLINLDKDKLIDLTYKNSINFFS
ncbi:TatD family hydrolase [Gammaproteobacteria bacterium]|nr:TatD family hydrolase [Gammaproteobacteria bacterium]